MAQTSTQQSPRQALQSILGTPYTYIVTLVLLFGTVFAAYAVHLVPQLVGIAGIGAGILGLAAFLSQDLSSEPVPTGWPVWTTFIVIVVVGALEAGVGQLSSTTALTAAGVIGLIVYIAQWIINALNQDAGANIPSSTEMSIVVLLGILVTALMGISTSGAVDVGTLEVGGTVTAIASLGGYVFAREKTNARIRAARAAAPH